MYLIKRIIKSSITIVSIIVQSVIDVIRLCFYPLSLSLKLILNRRKRRQYKAHRHDNYQSQIDGINTVIKDIKLSINTDHWYAKSALDGDRDTRLSEKIDTIDENRHFAKIELDTLSIKVKNLQKSLDDANKQIQGLNNRVNELELSQEDSTLTIFPDNEDMTIDEHVQHAMAAHEKEEGCVKEYDYHSELKAKEKSNE